MADYTVFVGDTFQRYDAGAREGDLHISTLFNARSSVLKAAEYLRNELKAGDKVLIKARDTRWFERIAIMLIGRTVRCNRSFCDTRVV